MADNNEKRNFLIVLLAAVFGYKVGKSIENTHQNGEGLLDRWLNPDLVKLKQFVREQLTDGISEVELLGAIVIEAENNLGRKLTEREYNILRQIVVDEKSRLQKKGAM